MASRQQHVPNLMQIPPSMVVPHLTSEMEKNSILQDLQEKQLQEIYNLTEKELNQQPLPLARIKRVMKSDEDVKMVAQDAPPVFAKACELFMQEITLRAWLHTQEHGRRTLKRADFAEAISCGDAIDFLADVVPREDVEEAVEPSVAVPTMDPNLQYNQHYNM